MRVVVLSDIHGNLPAFEAVLGEVRDEAPDLIVVCGDVASGPMPAETIDALRDLPRARFISGNCDRGVVAAYDGKDESEWSGPGADWCAAQLSRDQRDFLARFEPTVSVDVDGMGRVVLCHGSPHSDVDTITSRTSDGVLRERIAGVDAEVVVCGHTHMQFDRAVDGIRVLNAGSVGMAFGEPGAYWAVLGPDVQMRRTDYDREAAAARIGESSWLDAGAFARENVLAVPTAEEAFAFFGGRDLR